MYQQIFKGARTGQPGAGGVKNPKTSMGKPMEAKGGGGSGGGTDAKADATSIGKAMGISSTEWGNSVEKFPGSDNTWMISPQVTATRTVATYTASAHKALESQGYKKDGEAKKDGTSKSQMYVHADTGAKAEMVSDSSKREFSLTIDSSKVKPAAEKSATKPAAKAPAKAPTLPDKDISAMSDAELSARSRSLTSNPLANKNFSADYQQVLDEMNRRDSFKPAPKKTTKNDGASPFSSVFKSAKAKPGKSEPHEGSEEDMMEDESDHKDKKKTKPKKTVAKAQDFSFGQLRQAAVAKFFGL
jgi:hypothetical protein